MTAVSWITRGRYAEGLSSSPTAGIVTVKWSDVFSVSGFPWAQPNYPVFQLLGVGVTLTASAVVANRFPRINLIHPTGALTEWLGSGVLQASQTRRYEFSATGVGIGSSGAGAGVNFIYREPLPSMLILPGSALITESELQVSIANAQTGDSFVNIALRGVLLY